jgi:hypothetical protein
MAKYADLKFLKESDVPRQPGDAVFRQTWLGKLAVFLIFSILSAGLLSARSLGFDLNPIIAYLSGGSLVVFALVALAILRAALRPSNWMLRVAHNGLYLKYRSYRNHDFSPEDLTVVFIPRAEIVWLRGRIEDDVLPARGQDNSDLRKRRHQLLIKLHDDDQAALDDQLRQERQRWSPGRRVKGKVRHYPVRVLPGGLIEVDWSGSVGLGRALRLLGRTYRIEQQEQYKQAGFDGLTDEELEARLMAFAERGDTISAVIVAKRLYGYDTTEARKFVEELAAGHPAAGSDPKAQA